MIRHQMLILLAALFLSPTLALAQQSNATPADNKAADTALKEKAYELLDSLATQISTLQSAENRAHIGSNIAASIWTRDEKRARALFVAVGEDIKLGLQPPREQIDPSGEREFLMVLLHLRENTVDRIAKLDPEFAFDFLKTTEITFEDPQYGVVEKDRALAARLAKQISGTNPDLALKIGRKALEQGFSDDLLPLIRQLHRKNRAQGVTLYKETVQKLRNTKFKEDQRTIREDWQTISFAQRLAELTPPLADETAFREYIDILISAALANKCDKPDAETEGGFFCSQVGAIVEQMKKVDPQRAAKLKHLDSEEEEEGRPWGPEIYRDAEELIEAGDYDGVLALVKEYPGSKNAFYWRAFQAAQDSGDLESARKIANDYADNPEVQKNMFDQLERGKREVALTDAELEVLWKQAENAGNLQGQYNFQERFKLLLTAAVRTGSRDRKATLKFYDQLYELVQGMTSVSQRNSMQAFVAMLYCMDKSDRGFTIMESLMPKLNELIDSAAKLDGFDTNYMRDGEWNMSASGTLGQFLTELSRNAAYFAWCDFDRAVNLAAQFERTEIRMMAQLKLAQSILSGPPKRNSFNGFH